MDRRVAFCAFIFLVFQSGGGGAQPSRSECELPDGWRAVEARNPHYVIFGETHGSRESPELVGAIACALAIRGQRVLVGVEIASSTNPDLQRLWATSAAGFAHRLLSELPYYAEREDGVASVAMVRMLDRLHMLSKSGKKVDIVAFNGARDAAQVRRWRDLPGQGPHEAAQAENIAEAAARQSYDRVLVLVGNFHAQRRPAHWPNATFDPMALRLAHTDTIISLNQVFAAGTLWNCIRKSGTVIPSSGEVRDDQRDCGLHGHLPDHIPRGSVRIKLTKRAAGGESPQYDGEYWFPVVHGSQPASQVMGAQ